MPHSWLGIELQADISVWPLKPAINHTSHPAGTTQECINTAIQMAQHHYMKNKICDRALLWLRGSEKNLSKYLRHLPCVKSHDCSSNSSVDTSASPPLLYWCSCANTCVLTSRVWHKACFPPQLFYLFSTWGIILWFETPWTTPRVHTWDDMKDYDFMWEYGRADEGLADTDPSLCQYHK